MIGMELVGPAQTYQPKHTEVASAEHQGLDIHEWLSKAEGSSTPLS